jgi:hypothetical protein
MARSRAGANGCKAALSLPQIASALAMRELLADDDARQSLEAFGPLPKRREGTDLGVHAGEMRARGLQGGQALPEIGVGNDPAHGSRLWRLVPLRLYLVPII